MSEPGNIAKANGSSIRGGVRKKSINDINAQYDRITAGFRKMGNVSRARWDAVARATDRYIRNIEAQPEQRATFGELGMMMMRASNEGELNSAERARLSGVIRSRRYPKSVYARKNNRR